MSRGHLVASRTRLLQVCKGSLMAKFIICCRDLYCLRPAMIFLLCGLLLPVLASGQSATEDDLRAAMVSHLPLFVEWPAAKTDAAHPQFHVCLLGADPIAPVLEAAFHNASVLSAPVVFSRLNATDKLDMCHLLYIGTNARGSLAKLVPQLAQASVLTVSERSVDSAAGEVIGLPIEDNHIRIEVNLAAAQYSKLVVSSKLLHLATIVRH